MRPYTVLIVSNYAVCMNGAGYANRYCAYMHYAGKWPKPEALPGGIPEYTL